MAVKKRIVNSLSFYRRKASFFFEKKDAREIKIFKNVIISFGVKGGSILIGLIIVPLTINYISATNYGIWLTLSSIMSWMSFFDIGMGNGLRNKLTHAMAHEQYEEAKRYISSTYAALIVISGCVFLFFCIINPLINWRGFLNIPCAVTADMHLLLLILIGAFCIQLSAQIINVVVTAIHQSALAGFISFLGQLGVLITVLIFRFTVPASLLMVTVALAFVPLFILLIATLILFNGRLNHISPELKYVKLKYAKEILHVGGAFFLIQLGALVLFQTDNIIISRVIGPQSVTSFNIAYRLFSIIIMAFTILMTPYWSAFADAYAKKDLVWMKTNFRKMKRIWLLVSLLIIPVLFLLSDLIYSLWIGSSVSVSKVLSFAMACYAVVYTGMSLNSYFLNGLGKIRLQKYLYIIACFVNIPLSVWMTGKIGVAGAVFSNVIVLAVMTTLLWIQSNKILAGANSGWWGN
ncbi:lipopolysaccharide biosynthesis protein [Pedobacter sp. KLB.chiD]|uniref:lipopolysaccharide biosynthesis protein n=1 Tax=Pedobacter sp. KLB.chiD TaxID=3387402 RepID=UPI00399C46DA